MEDERIFREMVKRELERWGWEVLWEADGVKSGKERIEQEGMPKVVILDMDLPDGEGYELIDWIGKRSKGGGGYRGNILVLTGWTESYPVMKLRRGGAMGVVDKLEAEEGELERALEQISEGRLYFTERVESRFKKMVSEPRSYYRCLTTREEELVKYLGRGLSNAGAGKELGISALTVQGHRRNILRKLGLKGTPELMCWAVQEGFVKPRQMRVESFSGTAEKS